MVAALAVLAHTAALHGTSFTYDDHPIVAENPRLEVRGLRDLLDLATSDYWGRPQGAERLWRPTTLLSFALERRLHGLDPDLCRLTNVLLHALNAALSYALALALLGSRRGALLAAAAFALHPVHAEVTAGVVGRAELLALAGVLGGCALHRWGRGRGGPAATLAAALAFVLGAGAKEVALAGPVLCALLELAERPPRRSWLRWLAPYLVYVAAQGLYWFTRQQVLGDVFAQAGARTLGAMAPDQRLLLAGWLTLDQQLSLLIPHLSAAHYPLGGARLDPLVAQLAAPGSLPGLHPPAPDNPLALLPIPLHALLLWLGAAWLATPWRWARALGAGLWGFYLALGPVSNVLVPIGVLRADRLLYTPSWFFCLGLGAAGARLLRGRAPAGWALLMAGLGLVYVPLLQANVRRWTDDRRLWEGSLASYPDQARCHQALGQVLLAAGEREAAEVRLSQAVQLSPPGTSLAAPSRAGWGEVLRQRGALDEAERALAEARALDPGCVPALQGLALVHLDRALAAADEGERVHQLRQAERLARDAAHLADQGRLWYLLGLIQARLPGRTEEADMALSTALARQPTLWEAALERARLREQTGRPGEALADYRAACAALSRGPRTREAARALLEASGRRWVLARRAGLRGEAESCERFLSRAAPSLLESLRRAETEGGR